MNSLKSLREQHPKKAVDLSTEDGIINAVFQESLTRYTEKFGLYKEEFLNYLSLEEVTQEEVANLSQDEQRAFRAKNSTHSEDGVEFTIKTPSLKETRIDNLLGEKLVCDSGQNPLNFNLDSPAFTEKETKQLRFAALYEVLAAFNGIKQQIPEAIAEAEALTADQRGSLSSLDAARVSLTEKIGTMMKATQGKNPEVVTSELNFAVKELAFNEGIWAPDLEDDLKEACAKQRINTVKAAQGLRL